ncbi:MAG: O-antigen ligase family protein [Thermoleophilaceae bacterium]|nr:O-antigen ligase family protein [Thermoleophilaceae bacterium]
MSRFHASGATSACAVILGGALAGVAFGAAGGTELTRTTTVEVLMVLASAVLIAAGVLWGRRGPLYGATALVLFAALAAFTALSVTWALMPELAYIEAGRTLAYLATFAAALAAARVAPQASPVVLKGVLLAALAAVAYALASRIWPGTLAEHELSNRIGQPFQYWNAVGTTAALAIPAALWLGSRRTGSVLGRSLAYPALGACVLAIMLTQSRGALVAAALGTIAWFAVVPLRLRGLPVLLAGAIGGGAVSAWALSKDAFSKSLQPLSAKESVAGEFGLLVALMVLALLLAGLAVNLGLGRVPPPMRLRRRMGVAAVAVACVVPLLAFTSVAVSDRGLGGTIDDRLDELTSETETAPTEGAGRVTAASSTRGKYWREAGRVFDDRPVVGVGAANFATARLRYRKDATFSRHAHGFIPQTLADLGIVGLVLTTALLLAWLVAALRTTGLHPRRLPSRRHNGEPPPRRDWDGERVAVVALSLVAVVFGLQSAIDWTWFVPGPTAMALVAAGFVAGRGPVPAVASREGTAELPSLRWPPPRPASGRIAAAGAVGVVAVIVAWAIWQPEASDRATNRALELIENRSYQDAIAKTEDAAAANPLSADPLLVRAVAEASAGQESAARRTLERAVLEFPGDRQTWLRLATFQLRTLDRPQDALETVRAVLYLDPFSGEGRQLFLDARARLRQKQAEAAAPG